MSTGTTATTRSTSPTTTVITTSTQSTTTPRTTQPASTSTTITQSTTTRSATTPVTTTQSSSTSPLTSTRSSTTTSRAATTTTTFTSSSSSQPEKAAYADIVFVVDSSYLMGGSNYWQQVINFMVTFVSGLKIGKEHAQVGVVIIGWPATSAFYPNTYNNKTSLISAIQSIQYVPQWTYTASGLRQMTNDQFTLAHGDRPNFENIAIVILATSTNQGRDEIAAELQAAQLANIKLLAVGVTSYVNPTELIEICSAPKVQNQSYFQISDASLLLKIVETVINAVINTGMFLIATIE